MAEGRTANDLLEGMLRGPSDKIALYTDDSYVEGRAPQSYRRPGERINDSA
jgi:hypothetical protein